MKTILSLDIGTSSVRGILYSLEGKELFAASCAYSPIFLNDGKVRQLCSSWDIGVRKILSECGRFRKDSRELDILAVSVTSQRASVIAMDDDGTPIYDAIMWQDKTSHAECDYIRSKISPEDVYSLTGLHIDPYFSAPKILWLKTNEPEIFKRSARFVGVQDYVVYLLTGKYITDHSQACRTQLLDISSGIWSKQLLEIIGIEESALPEVVPPGTIAGELLPAVADEAGLSENIPVILAGGDQQVAALGMGVIAPGSVEANTGTGSFMISPVATPVFHPEMKTLCSMAAIPGQWVVEAGILTTGILYSWFAREFAPDEDCDGYGEINHLIENVPAGANGVLALPHFKGSAAPYWNAKAKGMFFNLTLANTRADMARAVLESIVLEMGANLTLIKDLLKLPLKRTVVAGGLTRFDLFNRLQADVFALPVSLPQTTEASALGALISAQVSLGLSSDYLSAFRKVQPEKGREILPDEAVVPVYRQAAIIREKLYSSLNASGIYDDAEKYMIFLENIEV